MVEVTGPLTPRWKQLEKPKFLDYDRDSLSTTFGTFMAEPFERGFGHTIGNSLRRILLSSISGAAVTSVQVEGAQHEFATLEGVKEDIIDIILNLKQLRVRLQGDAPRTLSLKVKGETNVTAANFEPNSAVEFVNPDMHIATLTEETAKLELTCEVAMGRGYFPAEKNRREDSPIGVIPVDSQFSPVTKVSYRVEDSRVGQMTDYDRLILDITTDGRIKPEDALSRAAAILKDHMVIFVNLEQSDVAPLPSEEEARIRELLGLSITELELSQRSLNCLQNAEIKMIKELVSLSEEEAGNLRNFGSKSLEEVKVVLADMGLQFGMDTSKIGDAPANVLASSAPA